MEQLQRDVGSLLEGQRWLQAELRDLRGDVKALEQFKWKVAGAAAFVSSLITLLVQVFFIGGKHGN